MLRSRRLQSFLLLDGFVPQLRFAIGKSFLLMAHLRSKIFCINMRKNSTKILLNGTDAILGSTRK